MRFLTAGESHGKGLVTLVEGFPAGVSIDFERINHELARRQLGYGRGGRMQIEKDRMEVLSGVRFSRTTGAPIACLIPNRDFANWQDVMTAEGPASDRNRFVRPRPGHADLAGYYKYHHTDLRDVLERSSARETAARVAAGAFAKELLHALGIIVFSHVVALGTVTVSEASLPTDLNVLHTRAEENDLRCAGDTDTLSRMRQLVDETRKAGSTLGGEVEVIATGVPAGLGSYVHWDRKLDGLLAQAVMSIQAVKSVSIGKGALGAVLDGTRFHDPIVPSSHTPEALTRPQNHAGGLEGGVTNGMPLLVRAVMKPIATLITPLPSVNLDSGKPEEAHFERSDVTAVPACGVVCEAMVAFTLANALLEKFGGDSLQDIQAALSHYVQSLPHPTVPV